MSRQLHSGSPRAAEYEDGRRRPRLTHRDFMLGGTVLLCCGCATAPLTGRRQFIVISPQQEMALRLQAYREVLTKEPITQDPKATAPLRRIVTRIAPVAERAARRADFQWEVNVIKDDKTINAFVLPGGKIGVYTGIFPVAQTEAGMAIILGHEMGHAIARHAAERLSQQLGAQLVGTVLAAGIQGSAYGNVIMAAFGLGAQDTQSPKGASRISKSIYHRPWQSSVPIPTPVRGHCHHPKKLKGQPDNPRERQSASSRWNAECPAPFLPRSGTPATQCIGVGLLIRVTLVAHRPVGQHDSTFGHEGFGVAVAPTEEEIEPYARVDAVCRAPAALRGIGRGW